LAHPKNWDTLQARLTTFFWVCTGSLDKALAAVDTLGIGNFDGQGNSAPEKIEIKAEVVGTATLRENLWRVKQQREALRLR